MLTDKRLTKGRHHPMKILSRSKSKKMMSMSKQFQEKETRKMRKFHQNRTWQTKRDNMVDQVQRRRFFQNRIEKERQGESQRRKMGSIEMA
jgi:hypothetical protein